jgi:hypothetical protein
MSKEGIGLLEIGQSHMERLYVGRPQGSALRESDVDEEDVVRRWWALPAGCVLPLSNGDAYQVVFAGRPGGSAGPDVRDAVFRASSTRARVVGDVEFHVRSSDWGVHQHSVDPRYNNVILHAVLLCDSSLPTLRQDGVIVPVCSLADLAFSFKQPLQIDITREKTQWPCHSVMQQLSEEERQALFKRAGLLHFEQKTHAFVEQIRATSSSSTYDLYDICIIPALAEGLGYGRDRDFFRATGLYLVGYASTVPEPLGRSLQPSPLDGDRLHVLRRLLEQWRIPGVWETLRLLLLPSKECSAEHILQTLRQAFSKLGLSLARTDILICNVVLPFAAAVALIEHYPLLAQRAEEVYILHPGLPSNRITRMMCAQLQLTTEPRGSCQQQGLHYIYQQTCREKDCDRCIAGRNVL